MSGIPSIPEFFRDKSVFITGGSGFIGKVLVEKLLRSCPDLENIYLLMREKKGKSPEERIKAITDLPLFDILKQQRPNAIEKIKLVNGDVSELNLGLSPENKQLLIDKINIIFHGAASVRFDDPLTDAVVLNTRGTREVCNLALNMKKLDVFVHISTTYCNTDRPVIDEMLYPAHADWEKTIEIVENVDRHTLDVLTPKYISPLPNTYTFTKSLAEHVVHDMCNGKIPAVVVRPSIVVSTLEDPFPGWIDNFNGPVGLFTASGKGIIRVVYCDRSIKSDYVPVDLIVKGIIISAWHQAIIKNPEEKLTPSFYNGGKNDYHPITAGDLMEMGDKICTEIPLNDVIWYPNFTVTKCYYYYFLKMVCYQLIPAIILDTLLRILGKKPMLVKIQRRVFSATTALSYFALNKWGFINEKALALKTNLLPCDVENFSFDEENVDPLQFFIASTLGARKYLLNEGEDLTEAKRHSQRMFIISRVFNVIWYLGLFWLIFVKIDVISVLFGMLDRYYVYLKEE